MDQLLWELIRNEVDQGRPGPADLAARIVLGDALAESGNLPLAQRLHRWPPDKRLWGTPLYRKLQAAVRGPAQRSTLDRAPQPKKLLLALVGSPAANAAWVSIDRNVGGPHDGDPYVVEMGMGYSSHYGLVWADDLETAYETAKEAFPFHFYREVDEDELDEVDEDYETIEGPHPTKPDVWLVEDESARHNTHISKARRVTSARRLDPYGRQARLRTGEIVEFTS